MSDKSSINDLKIYFAKLTAPQKKEFIQNLQKKISGIKDSKYREFLNNCIKIYNEEARKQHAPPPTHHSPPVQKKPTEPKLTDEIFAKAFATMLFGNKPSQMSVTSKLCGKWERKQEGKIFYFNFNQDGSLETNETASGDILHGRYSLGLDGILLLEPGEELGTNNIILTENSLYISFANGKSFEYIKKQF